MILEWMSDPSAWVGLATLVILEIVLGIDNLVFIAILAEKLPPEQRNFGYVINCESKCAGVIVYYPMSVAYGDGI